MAETFVSEDLKTLQAIARGAGIQEVDRLSPDQLVEALRRAGVTDGTQDQWPPSRSRTRLTWPGCPAVR